MMFQYASKNCYIEKTIVVKFYVCYNNM